METKLEQTLDLMNLIQMTRLMMHSFRNVMKQNPGNGSNMVSYIVISSWLSYCLQYNPNIVVTIIN